MKLYVLMGLRKERYAGEHGLEALAVMSECDHDENPAYMDDALASNQQTSEFAALSIVTLDVSEAAIRAVLFPASKPIPAAVTS